MRRAVDARQLEYFLAIVEHDGFGRAAAHLHIAQPSLSQAIANLARELGVQLFHRIGRGVVLSTAGSELVDATAAFTPAEVVEKVRQGVCELGLVGASAPITAPGIDVLPLEEQPFVLVGGPDSTFPDGDPVPHAALAGAKMIVSPAGGLMRQIVDQLLAEGAEMHIVVEVAHRTSILPLVLQGVGLAVLPSAWAPLARRAGARTALLEPAGSEARLGPPAAPAALLVSPQQPTRSDTMSAPTRTYEIASIPADGVGASTRSTSVPSAGPRSPTTSACGGCGCGSRRASTSGPTCVRSTSTPA